MTIISADQTSPSSLHNSISTFLILQSIFLKSSSSFNATSSTFGLTKIPWRFLILLNSRNSAIYSCRHLLQKYLDNIIFLLYRLVKLVSIVFFFYQGFPHRHWRFTGQQGKGGNHHLFYSTTSTRSRTLRHLFATLHVKWLSRIFNRNACVCQTRFTTLSNYHLSDWLMMQCLFVYLMNWY